MPLRVKHTEIHSHIPDMRLSSFQGWSLYWGIHICIHVLFLEVSVCLCRGLTECDHVATETNDLRLVVVLWADVDSSRWHCGTEIPRRTNIYKSSATIPAKIAKRKVRLGIVSILTTLWAVLTIKYLWQVGLSWLLFARFHVNVHNWWVIHLSSS